MATQTKKQLLVVSLLKPKKPKTSQKEQKVLDNSAVIVVIMRSALLYGVCTVRSRDCIRGITQKKFKGFTVV